MLLLDKEALSKRQAELETVVATLPEDSPLKEELGTQLEVVKDKLRDPRQPGAQRAQRSKKFEISIEIENFDRE